MPYGDGLTKPYFIKLQSNRTFKTNAELKVWVKYVETTVSKTTRFYFAGLNTDIIRSWIEWDYANDYRSLVLTVTLIPYATGWNNISLPQIG